MLKVENIIVPSGSQWEAVVRGCRNPYDSWDKSDSKWEYTGPVSIFNIGEADLALMMKLANFGEDHGKFMRMIPIYIDIKAPLYWWKEADQYKVGTVTNSCSTMHTITKKPFVPEDFSIDDRNLLDAVVTDLNDMRTCYLDETDPFVKKQLWRNIIQYLPSSYNQLRTWYGNYQVLTHMYHARKGHKLSEWEDFRKVIRMLPHSELITGEELCKA